MYQVIVRGKFAQLDADQRAALLARADDHDLLTARFTEEGTVTYDRSLVAFNFRCLISAESSDSESAVVGRAEKLATTAIRDLGADCRDLRSASSDLDNVKIRRKKR